MEKRRARRGRPLAKERPLYEIVPLNISSEKFLIAFGVLSKAAGSFQSRNPRNPHRVGPTRARKRPEITPAKCPRELFPSALRFGKLSAAVGYHNHRVWRKKRRGLRPAGGCVVDSPPPPPAGWLAGCLASSFRFSSETLSWPLTAVRASRTFALLRRSFGIRSSSLHPVASGSPRRQPLEILVRRRDSGVLRTSLLPSDTSRQSPSSSSLFTFARPPEIDFK